MSLLQHSYVTELELLILDRLLPIYIKYYEDRKVSNPLQGINEDLIKRIKSAKKLPALLQPPKK